MDMETEDVLKKFKKDLAGENILIRASVTEYKMRTLTKGEVKRKSYRFEVETK